ncbi:MAG: ANTAR domain-containing protein [Candidatus Metalachnospira sp.]|nr:ANTAR domain-containing protein [Candidatus Metalachnospira sp.]
MERIVVAFSNDNNRSRIAELLEVNNHAARKLCKSGKEAIRSVREMGHGIVVCGYKLSDMTADDLAYDLGDAGLVLVVAEPTMLDMCENISLCKLPTPIKRADFVSTIEMLIELESQKSPSANAKRTDEEKELIEEAKLILMEKCSMTEPEAHRFIQKKSMDSGFKIISTARIIIRSYSC